MAPAPPRRSTSSTVDQDARLAELVAGLTGCSPGGALDAVREQDHRPGDALAVVARAMVAVDQPHTPDGDPEPGLAHHGSLRRWERLDPDRRPGTDDAIDLTGA